METITAILTRYGTIGVESIKQDVNQVSATGKTAESVRFEVTFKDGRWTLTFYGREFFKAIETGRGPRRSSTYSGFDESLLEYMKARGIGSDLSEKKRKQLARFLAYKINREGDLTYKKGGRIVYSENLSKLVDELIKALATDVVKQYILDTIRNKKAA